VRFDSIRTRCSDYFESDPQSGSSRRDGVSISFDHADANAEPNGSGYSDSDTYCSRDKNAEVDWRPCHADASGYAAIMLEVEVVTNANAGAVNADRARHAKPTLASRSPRSTLNTADQGRRSSL
jgi:hypothetical protein